jgi:Cys-rich repeat protein
LNQEALTMTVTGTPFVAPALVSLALLLSSLTGCSSDGGAGSGISKTDARLADGRNPGGQDLCAMNDWYNDGWCDRFCPQPDHDCDTLGTNGCLSDSNCPAGQICDRFQCKPGMRDTPSCSPQSDCPAGMGCTSIGCLPLPCQSDSECTDGKLCDYNTGECVTQGSGAACMDDSTCGRERCLNGFCTTGGFPVDTPCTADSDCSYGDVCGLLGVCVAPEVGGEACDRDSQCMPGLSCLSGSCGGYLGGYCMTDSNCAAGQVCAIENDTSVCTQPCRTDSECPAGLLCSATTGTCAQTCTEGPLTACPANQLCKEGGDVCVPARPFPPGSCMADVDCPPDHVCSDHVCVRT